jgi:prevent-host-death family protein
VSKSIGVAEIKRHFSDVIIEVAREGRQFIIEKKGKPMAALVNIKDLEAIERKGSPLKKKGLLAAIGAWEEFGALEGVIKHIYEKRKTAQDRKLEKLS